MNIFATNDDGFEGAGLLALTGALKKAGHNVFTVAPDQNRSGSAHSMSIQRVVAVRRVKEDFWMCNGTPVDCVTTITGGAFHFAPDLVVSGINAGANLGTDIVYSGTAGAARQAALKGFPAIAFSLVDEVSREGGVFFWEEAAAWAVKNLADLKALCAPDVFVNVNMPNLRRQEDGFRQTFPVRRIYHEKMRKADISSEGWQPLEYEEFYVENFDERGSDYDAVAAGMVAASLVFLQPAVKMFNNGGNGRNK